MLQPPMQQCAGGLVLRDHSVGLRPESGSRWLMDVETVERSALVGRAVVLILAEY